MPGRTRASRRTGHRESSAGDTLTMYSNRRRAVIVTAIPIERTAVIEHLREVSEEPPLGGSIYRRGIFDECTDAWDVVVAEIGAGNVGAAAEAVRVISYYTPQVAI